MPKIVVEQAADPRSTLVKMEFTDAEWEEASLAFEEWRRLELAQKFRAAGACGGCIRFHAVADCPELGEVGA